MPLALPDLRVPLDHLDAGAAKAGDHLRVARVVALVRAEVEDAQAQRRISSTCCSRWRPPVRSSWWLATSSLTRPSETSWTPDDDEQHAERQQRAMADRLAGQLQHGQVDEQEHPDGSEQQADAAEEMQRPVPVAAHERDGEQIEEAADVALHPVARAPVLARAVVDRDLRDAEATVVGEHGDEAVQLPVDPEAVEHFRPIGLQAAVEIVQAQSREPAGDAVEDAGRDPSAQRVAPLRLPARDEVEALVELREQARNLGRVVLEVAVDRDDDVALRLLEARPAAPPPCRSSAGGGRRAPRPVARAGG